MSLDEECDWRLENLYKESHIWLLQAATNITKHSENAEDLVMDLYVYLGKKKNPNIFWGHSYNLMYCHRTLKTRWINKLDKMHRITYEDNMRKYDCEEGEYDMDRDIELMQTYDKVIDELTKLKGTKMFAQASIYEMYWMSDDKMMDVADKIGISKSTTFNAIKKIKTYLSQTIENPFGNE